MNLVRSTIFSAIALLWTVGLSILYLPLLWGSRRFAQRCCGLWARTLLELARVVCGVRYQVRGRENLPKGPAIIAAKHQSAWETLLFHSLLEDPVYVLKKELVDNVLIGRYLRKVGNIGIDRGAGMRALKPMVAEAGARLAEGAQVIIFPEGTRVPPGEHRPYLPGVAALYSRYGDTVPLIPVAHNSGLFWRRWTKVPGEVVVSVMPPVPKGLDRRALMAELELRIEGETLRLSGAAAVENHRQE